MSTTFEVYPKTTYIPQITEVLTLANQKLQAFLNPLELNITPIIVARIGETRIDSLSESSLSTRWEVEYSWFYVTPNEHGGGSDAYFVDVNELVIESWEEYEDFGYSYAEVLKSLSVGYYWSFRRSAGQPAIINLAYGFLAAALAELTGGYIFSDDGAWPGPPIRAAEFEAQYFKPELANSYGDASWYIHCLTSLTEDYQGKPYVSSVRLLTEHDWSMNQRLRYSPSGRTLQEGPVESDRLIILHSHYINFPYVIINCSLVKADEDVLLLILKLTDIKEGLKLDSQPVNSIFEIDLKPMLANLVFTFWSNPLLGEDGEVIRRLLTED